MGGSVALVFYRDFGRRWLLFTSLWRLCFQPPDAVLPEHCQSFAVQVEISEGEVRVESVVVLGQAPISHLIEPKDALDDAEHMLYLRPDAGLTPVLLFL